MTSSHSMCNSRGRWRDYRQDALVERFNGSLKREIFQNRLSDLAQARQVLAETILG